MSFLLLKTHCLRDERIAHGAVPMTVLDQMSQIRQAQTDDGKEKDSK